MLTSKPVPDTWIQTPDLKQKGIQLCIRREDLTHPVYGGNKLRKLKYHFEAFKNSQYTEVLSFGGAWSNHVFAISGACMELDIPCRLIIRGEEPQAPSSTLIYAKNSGAQLHFVSREEYRKRYEAEYIHELQKRFPEAYIIPEGGSGVMGAKGCVEIYKQEDVTFDIICCPLGSGGTCAGLAAAAHENQQVFGFSALKGGDYLKNEIDEMLVGLGKENHCTRYAIVDDYHFGGFAKFNDELIAFMRAFHANHGIALDPLYTGKMMFGLLDMIDSGKIQAGSSILVIHTGGLQGVEGIEKRLGEKLY